MNRFLLSISGACVVLGAASCSSTPEDKGQTGGAGGTGSTSSGTTGGGPQGTGGGGGNGTGSVSGGGTGGGSPGTGASPGTGGATSGTGGLGTGATSGIGGLNGSGGSGTGGTVVVDRPPLVTSGVDSFWNVGTLTPGTGTATITVDENTTHQKWHGFGGTFNEAGWIALSALSAADREQAIKLLFSPSEGANFAWGRIPIGASDYAYDRYTLNETPGDTAMANFSIARDQERLIPYIKAAQAVKSDIKFWGSPWTPPTWMKTEQEFNGTDLLPDKSNEGSAYHAYMKNDPTTMGALALYFARWVQAYNAEGIHIDHVQPQNEPGYDTRYPSCRWEGGQLGTFVGEHLGPTLETEGLDTKIWFGTLSNNEEYSSHISGLSDAANYVEGVGLQWNTKEHIPSLISQGYLIMQTEHKCGNYPWLGQTATSAADANRDNFLPGRAPNNHAYGEESWDLIKEWIDADVNIYSAWNMVLDTLGQNLDAARPWPQNALLVVDTDAKKLTPTPAYYVFRHISYFVDPGADRISVTGNALAFQNPDQSIIVIVHNSGSSAAQTNVSVKGTTLQVDIPARGWATLNVEG